MHAVHQRGDDGLALHERVGFARGKPRIRELRASRLDRVDTRHVLAAADDEEPEGTALPAARVLGEPRAIGRGLTTLGGGRTRVDDIVEPSVGFVITVAIVVIFGPPAVGKMTVGREVARLTGYKLFHNHMTVEPVLEVFEFGSPPCGWIFAVGVDLEFEKISACVKRGITAYQGDMLEFMRGFTDGAVRGGAKIEFGVEARALKVEGGRVVGVEEPDVVLRAGDHGEAEPVDGVVGGSP